MYSKILIVIVLLGVVLSCSPYRKMRHIRSGEVAAGLAVSDEKPLEEEQPEIIIDSIRSNLSDGPIIMNAIKDSLTGEMVATDVITASKVVARFRNVAERGGSVSISFDVTVPAAMLDSRWRLQLLPWMRIFEDTVALDVINVTGARYRAAQLRGYERYEAFLASIITDTTVFVRRNQLEIFLRRHYPETYAMKRDSSIVPEPAAENLFGVTQREALEHYTNSLRKKANERKMARKGEMFAKYVKDPLVSEGVRLDTVLVSSDGDFTYRYRHTFLSRPGLKKVMLTLEGRLYEGGECVSDFHFPDELTYYISSLSTLVDETIRYMLNDTEIDTVYVAGVEAIKALDYKRAVTLLRPYRDYNSALAMMSADYNHSALDMLDGLDDTNPKVCYLKAMVLSRLGQTGEAEKYYRLAVVYDPYLRHRANLDPEMHKFVKEF